VIRWALALLALLTGVAIAGPPRGYKCGDGKKLAGKGCECPTGKVDARDKTNFAICIPEPAPTTCLAARAGQEVIKIDTSPDAATIYIGDKSCGIVAYTPWTGKLAAGPVTIILERTSFEPVTKTVTVSPRATQELYVPLVRTNIGTLDVRGDADRNVVGATIVLDGKPMGVVPLVVKVAGGRHQLDIKKDGFDVFTQWLEVSDSQVIAVLPVLKQTATKLGKLIVDADVADVEVFVDEVKRSGALPLVIAVNEGAHVVEVRKAGATTWRQTVFVRASDQTLVRAELLKTIKRETLATIKVTAKVTGKSAGSAAPVDLGEVFVDGTSIGKAPLELELAPGEHWLVVKLAGYKSYEQKLQLEIGKTVAIAATLAPVAQLQINSTPAGSTVFIDKTRVGTTPVSIELELGPHLVWIDRTGYQRYEERVTLTGPAKSISATLKQ
jgi:hypothetical protein